MRETYFVVLKTIRHFLELVRFSHTLFALPFALGSMIVAAGGFPGWKICALILLAMVAARTAAIGYCFGGTTVLELARAGASVRGPRRAVAIVERARSTATE